MDAPTTLPPQSHWVRGRGAIGMAILAPFAMGALFSRPYASEGTLGDLEFDLAAFLLFVAGAYFRFWATLYIGGRKGCGLATFGPYSLCRNPLYFGTFLMTASLVVFLQNLTLAAGAIVASIVYLSITVGSEEHRLRHRFGADYDDYCRRVPRFWPNVRCYQAPAVIEVNLVGLRRECLNSLRWLWIPIAGEGLAYARTMELLPHLFQLP